MEIDNKIIINQMNIHLTALDDNNEAIFHFRALNGKSIKQLTSSEKNWQENILSLIKQGYQLFVNVNEADNKGVKAANITKVRALFLDLDDTSQDNLAIIETMPLAPNLVVNSSKGKFHCYWRVDDCPLDQFTKLQKALAAKYNGDTSVSDLPRIMRLAGSYNLKNEPQQVNVISHQDEVYTTNEIITAFSFGSFGTEELGVIDKKITKS